MARSIVLRYDATCFDCGAPLSAGTTARWFGKGRVSCCGDDDAPKRQPVSPGPGQPGQPLPLRHPAASAAVYAALMVAVCMMARCCGA